MIPAGNTASQCACVVAAASSGLARVLPAARPGESVRLVLPRRRAPGAAAGRAAPTAIVLARHGVAPGERHDPVQEAADAPLVTGEGCDVRSPRGPLGDGTRQALLLWLPPARGDLLALESGALAGEPAVAVSLLLRPPTIWQRADAVALAPLLRSRRLDAEAFAMAERRARACVGPRVLLRQRAALARLEAHAPFAGLPRATATVREGCAALRDDACRAAEAAAMQLARYAWVVGHLDTPPAGGHVPASRARPCTDDSGCRRCDDRCVLA